MIEVSLVCGFLGAGKTTWLGRRLRDGAAVDAVIVNDYAAEEVDAHVIRGLVPLRGPHVAAIHGGCVCCDRSEELLVALRGEVSRQHLSNGSPSSSSHLVIETSGLAQPAPVLAMLTEDPVLRWNTRLREVVVLVDGAEGARLLRHHAAVRAHIRLADRVVITRADLVTQEHLEEVASLVRGVSPAVALSRSSHGEETPLRLPEDAAIQLPPCPDSDELNPRSWSVALSREMVWADYALWLHSLTRAHPDRMLRSKGTVWTPDGPVLIQTLGAIVAAPVKLAVVSTNAMTFITHGIEPELLARSLAAFVPSAVSRDGSM